MILPLVSSLAFASPPSGNPGRIAVGDGAIERMEIGGNGEVLVGRDRASSSAWLVAIDDWSVHAFDTECEVSGIATVPVTDDYTEIYLACSDGFVEVWAYSDGEVFAIPDDSGAGLAFAVTAGQPLLGLWWNGDSATPLLYALEDGELITTVHVLNGLTGATDGEVLSAYATPPNGFASGFVEGVVDLNALYIAHGGTRFTVVNLDSGGLSTVPPAANLYGVDDLASGGGKLWAVDTDLNILFEFFPNSGLPGAIVPNYTAPRAVVANTDPNDEWLLVSGDGLWVHELAGGAILDATDPFYVNTDADLNIQDAVANSEYAFGGGGGGNVHVITAKPWVDEVSASPQSGDVGTILTLDFTIDDAADWEVTLNGDRTGSGETLASGTTSAGEAIVTTTVEVTDDFIEGTNRLYVVATDALGEFGHGAVDVVIDTPPEPPELTDANVGFGDASLVLSFEGIPDEDLAEYRIWISDVPFAPEDFETGGPAGLESGPASPLVVTAVGGTSVSQVLAPLINGTTYFIGVRSYDAGGLESGMSNVVQGTPEETFTATDLAGEAGGASCSTSPTSMGWMAIGLAGLATLARRRMGTAGAVVMGLGLTLPAMAADGDAKSKRKDRGDLTGQYGNFELRYGGFFDIDDDAIKQVYGDGGHNMLSLEVGPQFFRFFEIDAELGFYQELATTVTAGATPSSTKTMLTYWPLGLSGTFRLQLLDEQIIVPHVRLGADYVVWNELTDNVSGGKDKVNGSKMGNHYAIGGSLLLDTFSRGRASLLEAQTGINDTYLTFEWRKQNIDDRNTPWAEERVDGLTFSGTLLTIGLKLDY